MAGAKFPAFNGGKMEHVFEARGNEAREWGYHDGPVFVSEEAERAFREGPASSKIHGENSLLEFTADGPIVWNRQDGKTAEMPTGARELPPGPQPSVYDNGKGRAHFYRYIPLDPKWTVKKKGKRKANAPGPDTYAAVGIGVKAGVLLPEPGAFYTFEWVGRCHQGNIDAWPFDHGIVIHSQTRIREELIPRTWEQAVQRSKEWDIEGLVYQDPISGKFFKLRFDAFSGARFKVRGKNTPTSFRPQALCAEGVVEATGEFFGEES